VRRQRGGETGQRVAEARVADRAELHPCRQGSGQRGEAVGFVGGGRAGRVRAERGIAARRRQAVGIEAGDGADRHVADLAAHRAEQEGGEVVHRVEDGRAGVLDRLVVTRVVGGGERGGRVGTVVFVGEEDDRQPCPVAEEAGVG